MNHFRCSDCNVTFARDPVKGVEVACPQCGTSSWVQAQPLVDAFRRVNLLHAADPNDRAEGQAASGVLYQTLMTLQRKFWHRERYPEAEDAPARLVLRLSQRKRPSVPDRPTEASPLADGPLADGPLADGPLADGQVRAYLYRALQRLIEIDPGRKRKSVSIDDLPPQLLPYGELPEDLDLRFSLKQAAEEMEAARRQLRDELIPRAATRFQRSDGRTNFDAMVRRLEELRQGQLTLDDLAQAERKDGQAPADDRSMRRLKNRIYKRVQDVFERLEQERLRLCRRCSRVRCIAIALAIDELRPSHFGASNPNGRAGGAE